jgi:hypothetical protein
MIPVLSIVLPVFGLIGLGVAGGTSRLFGTLNLNIVCAYDTPSFAVWVAQFGDWHRGLRRRCL